MKPISLKPRLSEKSYALAEQLNTYVFDVPATANKHDVQRAVAEQYQVKVNSVRLAKVAGKKKRSIRGGGRSVRSYKRADIAKAYVCLPEGEKLPIYAATDEPKAKPAAQEKK